MKDIENVEQMVDYFDILFDDSIKNLLQESSLSDWEKVGWRGYMFKDGLLWVTDSGLISVNYESKKEKALREALLQKEKNSLSHYFIEDDWEPEGCYQDMNDSSVIRIDKRGDNYRLSVYRNQHQPTLLYGNREVRGTMSNLVYKFSDRRGLCRKYEIYVDKLYTDIDGVEEIHALRKCYWLDLVDESGGIYE